MLLEPIHGVVVCAGFSDYLDVSLAHNRPLFTKCVVVTSPDDKETQRVAGKHNCTLVITEDGNDSDCVPDTPEFGVTVPTTRPFNKGAMIERGLQQLPQNGFRVHFDADIVFPGNMRQRLGDACIDPTCIYGCDRMNVIGWDAWQKLIASGWAAKGFEHHHFLTHSISKHEVGSRLIYGEQGWVPIGYFQLWHHTAEYSGIYRTRTYSNGSNSAAHDDVQFSLLFDRKKRVLIPEFYVAHLMTEDTHYGKNWNGRVTKKFGPPDPKEVKKNGAAPQNSSVLQSNDHCAGSGPGFYPTWGEVLNLARILSWQDATIVFFGHITWGKVKAAAAGLRWNDNTPLTVTNLLALFRALGL